MLRQDITISSVADGLHLQLQLTDFEGNHNKVWIVQYDGETMTTQWGRVGSRLQQSSRSATPRYVVSRIHSKLKKGYDIIPHITDTADFIFEATPKIRHFIKWAYVSAMEDISDYFVGDVGALSLEHIERAEHLLQEISNTPVNESVSLVQDYYRAIPTKLPSKIDALDVTRDFHRNIETQESRLRQLRAARTMSMIDKNKSVSMTELLGCEVFLPSSKRREKIVQHIVNSSRGKLQENNIKMVIGLKSDARISRYHSLPHINEQPLLYHGTRPPYVLHIIRGGLLIAKASKTGLFGAGLYFGTESSKSLGYTGTSRGGYSPLFVAQVNMGRVHKAHQKMGSADVDRLLSSGYDSVWAHKKDKIDGVYRGALQHDEIVVYNNARVLLTEVVLLKR